MATGRLNPKPMGFGSGGGGNGSTSRLVGVRVWGPKWGWSGSGFDFPPQVPVGDPKFKHSLLLESLFKSPQPAQLTKPRYIYTKSSLIHDSSPLPSSQPHRVFRLHGAHRASVHGHGIASHRHGHGGRGTPHVRQSARCQPLPLRPSGLHRFAIGHPSSLHRSLYGEVMRG